MDALTALDIFPDLAPPVSEEAVLEEFKAFLKDMGKAPEPNQVIRKHV